MVGKTIVYLTMLFTLLLFCLEASGFTARSDQQRSLPAAEGAACSSLHVCRPHVSFIGGHSEACFQSKPVSYEYCRILLSVSPNCSALSYKYGNCWLHDRARRDFAEVQLPGGSTAPEIRVVKLTHGLDQCVPAGPVDEMKATALYKFEQCMALPREPISRALPLLAVVISVTVQWSKLHDAELNAVVDNLKCYCTRHGYAWVSTKRCCGFHTFHATYLSQLYLQHLNKMEVMDKFQFFHQRHVKITEAYLPRYTQVSDCSLMC